MTTKGRPGHDGNGWKTGAIVTAQAIPTPPTAYLLRRASSARLSDPLIGNAGPTARSTRRRRGVCTWNKRKDRDAANL